MKKDTSVHWHRTSAALDLDGKNVAVVGGTGGIGRALSRQMATRGAQVTVVGRTFRDRGMPNIEFVQADLDRMSEAQRVAQTLPAEDLDVLVLTTGIFAAPQRQETPEGLERDMAVSYLSRLVLVRNLAARLGTARPEGAPRPRVFVYGYPGSGQTAHVEDLNFEKDYVSMKAHMSTVAGNEALVLDSAQRYPGLGVFGLNPGLIKTDIRANMLGEGSWKHRAMETAIGWFTPDADTYAKHILPLLFTPDLEHHTGTMFDKKGSAILPSQTMTTAHVRDIIKGSEHLLTRKVPAVRH
ncbi:NAD(P)-dependent dehydrogenase (short-subunit alcohol dehydrogenase family) [Promicromonospora sp. AC04]|uniref:SDR family NAD(P)-dependent oxidoreductase n=1 Tax=Promicromonospora sp. AC04 TaxID=2135723 RepID=UPI000D38A41C|nr:SDR family NAD(P)-dependent oxidoreductase [Promicromonospora sp. AC04]PUB27664.1 NAD(P)-dependent dehydrogenase (short-subunit alcohol dehydrogenase family) [Promicromonospora sp. AC04]